MRRARFHRVLCFFFIANEGDVQPCVLAGAKNANIPLSLTTEQSDNNSWDKRIMEPENNK